MVTNLRSTRSNYILICFCILLIGCTSYVPVQRILPPEIIMAEESADFLFVNRFKPDDLDYNNENKVEVFEMGIESYIKGLQAGFDTCRQYNLLMSDTIIASHSAHEPAYNLSQIIIQTLSEEHDPDYIFSLDNYDLYFDQEVQVYEDDEGNKSKTAYYDLVLNTYITIYAADGNVVDKMKEELRILHDSRGVLSGLLAVGPSMGKADENVLKISDELGRMFIQKFYPTSVSEMRLFYARKEFAPAFKAYLKGDWNSVERDLLQLAKIENKKTQGRAAYNLAIFYENLGKIEDMEYWYRRAEEKLGSLPNDPFSNLIAPN